MYGLTAHTAGAQQSLGTAGVVPIAVVASQQVVYVQSGIKSSGLAAVLSFFWCGLGQIYTGRIGAGIAMIFCHPVLLLLGYALSLGGCVSAIGATTASEKTTAGGVFMLGLVFLLGALALWIFGIINAYRAAEQTNAYELAGLTSDYEV